MIIETRLSSCEVAIVGAGPVGLLLAGELALNGIRVQVFERATVPSLIPKANGIVGRVAVELAKRGVFAGTGLRVVSPPRFQFGPLALRLGSGPGNPLHILPVPQRRLEEMLESRAVKHGVQIYRGHEVLDFTQAESEVRIEVRRGDEARVATARYLVGCDGARSLVRRHAGIGFTGFTSDEIARIARVTIPSDRITRTGDGFDIPGIGRMVAMRPNQLPGGTFSLAPVSALDPAAPPDLYLISTHEPRDGAEPSDNVTTEELRSSLHRVLGAELPFAEATAIRSTVGNSRQADAYQAGRVFLAGDAAHVFNAGGSALNVGLQDALDLAHLIAVVLRGGAANSTLHAYDATRRAAGERALQHTRAQAALSGNSDDMRALREILQALLTSRSNSRQLARLIEDA